MYYLRARYYDPDIRRFISEDPAHDGRNWYAYCNGNPIKYWDPWGLEYGKIRDFVEDYRGAFKGKISIETRPGLDFAFITMGKYGKAFYYDGTISNIEFDDYGNIIKEERIKVADAIDGHLYMQRSAFVIAMGMVDGGDATVTVSDKFYVDDSLAMLDFASNIVSSSSNASDITSLYDLLGKAPALGKAVQLGATLYQLEEKIRKGEMMSTGYYRAESVVVKSPYFDIYSYQVDTLYGVDRNTSYYQWANKNSFLWGWLPE